MIPPEMGQSPPKRLLQSLQILVTFSLAHLLKNSWQIFDERVDYGGKIAKQNRHFLLFAVGGGCYKQLITYQFYSLGPDNR